MLIRNGFLAILLFVSVQAVKAQTCTISGSGTKNWDNNAAPGTTITCIEGGSETAASIIVVPSGVTLAFDDNGDTWTGTRIDVYGFLSITAAGNVRINSNIIIKDDGQLSIGSKLQLGSSGGGCNYNIITEIGGTLDIVGASGGSDRLDVCGVTLVQGGGGCNSCGGTYSGNCTYNNQPYCENGSGFSGPVAFDKNGFNSVLPIELIYFKVHEKEANSVKLEWSTASETNFDKFIIERSSNGTDFEEIGIIRENPNFFYGDLVRLREIKPRNSALKGCCLSKFFNNA